MAATSASGEKCLDELVAYIDKRGPELMSGESVTRLPYVWLSHREKRWHIYCTALRLHTGGYCTLQTRTLDEKLDTITTLKKQAAH
jgi:hypothetical protein